PRPFILSNNTLLKIKTTIQGSLAPSTLRTYRNAVTQFHIFCDQERIPRHVRTPTPEIVLCAFAADDLGQVASSTIRNRLVALKAWHTANNWPWHGSDRLSRVLSGVNNMTPSTSIQPKCPPITIQALETLTCHLDHSDPLDMVVLACACTAFWGQCRLGELIPTSQSKFKLHSFLTQSAVRHSPNNCHTRILNLPSTKTNC
ncbi:hypothetical protein P691DRAFT_835980, partial [Macrolepiota fuliginosa MF-IS2]